MLFNLRSTLPGKYSMKSIAKPINAFTQYYLKQRVRRNFLVYVMIRRDPLRASGVSKTERKTEQNEYDIH
jgi:hypothetical protein